MRSSSAVTLLLASSMSIFGIYATHSFTSRIPGPEPVWVNGQQGVYHPFTHEFIPISSPRFAETCALIVQQRQANATTQPVPGYYSGTHYYHYGSSYGGASNASSFGGGSSHVNSSRGGIGSTGHSFGGGGS